MTTSAKMTSLTMMTISTMMTIVFVRKMEVVHKQAGGYLIPYNLQPPSVRKLEVIWPDARIATSIALNWNIMNDSLSPLDM